MARMTVTIGVVCVIVAALAAQQGAPAFEVASVRPSRSTSLGGSITVQPGGRLVSTGTTLRDLVVRAYALQDFQLSGADGWISSDRFDVTAQAGTAVDTARLNVMLRSLLRDRFKLRVVSQERTLPIYRLVAVREDRLGTGIRKSARDCNFVLTERGVLDTSPLAPNDAECQPTSRFVTGPAGATITLKLVGASIGQLTNRLMPFVGRTVVDATGLKGTYDIDLTFSPANTLYRLPDGTIGQGPQSEGMSVATALQEQLGLKLESARGPVEVLVIESAERPTPD